MKIFVERFFLNLMDLVGQGVKFVFELYIRQKFGMNIKFPEMDNCIMIYFKMFFFLGIKGS